MVVRTWSLRSPPWPSWAPIWAPSGSPSSGTDGPKRPGAQPKEKIMCFLSYKTIFKKPFAKLTMIFTVPTRISPLESSTFREYFPNFTEVLIFWKMSTKRSKYRFRFFSANKDRVTKFYPVYRINITYKFYFILFSLILEKYFWFFVYALLRYFSIEGGIE